jgi:hypothetical protein
MRILLTSLNVPGYEVTFDALSRSSKNRIRKLLEEVVANGGRAAGAAGYVHPVIRVKIASYLHKAVGREIAHFDYELVDWMNTEGALWSRTDGGGDDDGEPAPWATKAA